jgi:hypothetical protein
MEKTINHITDIDDDLIQCPFCGSTEYIYEREDAISIIYGDTTKECKYFCSYCIKDF